MHVKKDNVGTALEDYLDGCFDLVGLAHDVHRTRDFGTNTCTYEFVVVD